MDIPLHVRRSRAVLLPITAGIAVGVLFISNTLATICVTLGGLAVALLGRKPLTMLGLLILIIPFIGPPSLSQNLLPLPGTKPFQLLAVVVTATAIWNLNRAQRMPRYAVVFTLLFVVLFTVCGLRALPNLEYLAIKGWAAPSVASFILTDYVKPLIFLLPLFVVPLYCRNVDDLDQLIRFLVAATVGLAVSILYISILESRSGSDVRAMSEAYSENMGLHRNAMGSLLMVGFPFIIARCVIRRNILNVGALILTVVAIGVLLCRTAYVTTVMAPIMYAVVSKRKMVPVILMLALAIIPLSSTVVRQRAMKGLESKDLNEITAGRVENVWLPLLDEYLADPVKLLFGRGRYAIVSTEASQKGHILEVQNAHNMYLEQILDIGLIGLLFMFLFMVFVFKRFLKTIRAPGDVRLREYRYAVAVSAACYFMGGLVGRSVFPKTESSFFWIMLAIAVVIPLIDRSDQLSE